MNAPATAGLPSGKPLIVVSVGSDHHRFDRLVDWMDGWLAGVGGRVDCVIQHGTAAPSIWGVSVPYMEHGELQRLLSQATAVVAQGGPLSIIEPLKFGRRPIVVPRLARLREVVDDHQQAFCERLAAEGKVLLAESSAALTAALDAAIADPRTVQFAPEADRESSRTAIRQIAHIADSLATQQRGRGPTVLMLGGFGRSGSTLLERCLGEVPGVVALGEVLHLWERGLRDDERCGCGERFSRCEFWRKVGSRAFGGWSTVMPDAAAHDRVAVVRTRRLPGLLMGAVHPRRRLEQNRLVRRLGNLYAAVQDQSGASVLVDSSKHPAYAFLLRRAPVQLRCVLAVRDPRGVAFSWQKSVVRPEVVDGVARMPRYSVIYTAVRWLCYSVLFHLLSTLDVPVITVRYEDFVEAPGPTLSRILRFVGLESAESEMTHIRRNSVVLGIHHTVAGNPMRFGVGEIELRLDDTWQRELPPLRRATVSVLTAPLRYVYGYMGRGQPATTTGRSDAVSSPVERIDDALRGNYPRSHK